MSRNFGERKFLGIRKVAQCCGIANTRKSGLCWRVRKSDREFSHRTTAEEDPQREAVGSNDLAAERAVEMRESEAQARGDSAGTPSPPGAGTGQERGRGRREGRG